MSLRRILFFLSVFGGTLEGGSPPPLMEPEFQQRVGKIDKLRGLSRDFAYLTHTHLSYLTHRRNYSPTLPKCDGKPLCALLHGLGGKPSAFDTYHDKLTAQFGDTLTLFQPPIYNKGACTLEQAANPIYDQIAPWAEQNPDQPLILVGISNGARIAAYLASKLKLEANVENPIHVSCLAGPFYGTKVINQPHQHPSIQEMWKRGVVRKFGQAIFEELSWGSERGQRLIENMQKVADQVQFDFYTSRVDSKVKPYVSSCPHVPRANYYFVQRDGHTSIVRASRDKILENLHNFISRVE